MAGLLDSLGLSQRALQVHQQGLQVAGHNLANINNTAYARQRLALQTTTPIATPTGALGTGLEIATVLQARSAVLDREVTAEESVTGSLQARQRALESAQATLGNAIGLPTDTVASTSAPGNSGASLAGKLSDFFNAFQDLATAPADITARLSVIASADSLAAGFRQTAQRLDQLDQSLDQELETQLTDANRLLGQIANLNQAIARYEGRTGSTANDLRDTRQQRLEELAHIVRFETAPSADGQITLSIAGVEFVNDSQVVNTLETYLAAPNQRLIRAVNGALPLDLVSGALQGSLEARDGPLHDLRANLDALANLLVAEVNRIHQPGFGLQGPTGAEFFTGTGARDLAFNPTLRANPAALQAAAVPDAPGDNQVALALARLAEQSFPALNGQTISEHQQTTATALAQALAGTQAQLADQRLLQTLLKEQRASVSGVSLDEEMADLVTYQRAYQASARLLSTIDQLLAEAVNLKR
ncbi:MAG: flagellar hook-associated protein FlgK [Verrucomicrobia bacterium]|nr:flagellar hook-associated protein FlgK [Verrucomicrobiota bacterium]